MGEPLYRIGEDVYLVGTVASDGEATVLEVSSPEDILDPHCQGVAGYFLTIPIPPGNSTDACWCECALRKRPPPEEEFKSFRAKLDLDIKQPVKEKVTM